MGGKLYEYDARKRFIRLREGIGLENFGTFVHE